MKRRTDFISISTRAAGLWLRCFLSGTLWVMLCLAVCSSFEAQVQIPEPERLSHVEGIIVNPEGHPVADVEVTLVRDERVAFRTRTDASGAFRFEKVPGQYIFKVQRSEYAPAAREIVVTSEVVTALARKKLYVILGPGACKDECSSVLTSKREFDKALRRNRHHE